MALKIGTKVKVIKIIDKAGNRSAIGRTGVIVDVETGDGDWPCGETPEDPAYIVQTDLTPYIVQTDLGTDMFWTEELEVLDKLP